MVTGATDFLPNVFHKLRNTWTCLKFLAQFSYKELCSAFLDSLNRCTACFCIDPVHKVSDTGVNSRLVLLSTVVSPANDAVDVVRLVSDAGQGASGVALHETEGNISQIRFYSLWSIFVNTHHLTFKTAFNLKIEVDKRFLDIWF